MVRLTIDTGERELTGVIPTHAFWNDLAGPERPDARSKLKHGLAAAPGGQEQESPPGRLDGPAAVPHDRVPDARGPAVLRRSVEVGGTASYEDIQQYFAEHPPDPTPRTKIGGRLTSIKAVQRRVGPAGAGQRDEQARLNRVDRVLVEGLRRAFVLADTRPDLLRR